MAPPALTAQLGLYACSFVLCAAVVRVMRRVGKLDRPGQRSSHTVPTPKGGGVGIVLAFLAGLGVSLAWPSLAFAGGAPGWVMALGAATLVVAGFSLLDDWYDLLAWWKLLVQVAAGLILALGGLNLSYVFAAVLPPLLAWPAGVVVAVAWYVLAMNAVNFIDGLNGLASGATAVACLAVFALFAGLPAVSFLALTAVAAVAGFLPYNYPKASIFMGDVGSQFCGLLVAALGVAIGTSLGSVVAVFAGPFLLSGILFDVLYTLLRRFLAGDRLHEAHRTHLYQLASRSRMSAAQVTLVHWGFVAWGALCFALLRAGMPVLAFVLLLAPQAGWLGLVMRWTERAGVPSPRLVRRAR